MPTLTTLDDEGFIKLDPKQRVQLLPYKPRQPKIYELMTDAEIEAGVGGTLIADTEVYYNFFLICFKDVKTKKIIKFQIGKHTDFNPFKLSWILNSYTIVTFNGIKYDLPLMWLAYYRQHTETIKEASNALVSGTWPAQLAKELNYTIHSIKHIDLIEVCPLRGSLKLYGARLHGKRIQDLPYDHLSLVDDKQIKIITDYCINDLDLTELAFENLKEQLDLRYQLSAEYNQDLMSKSDAQIAEAVIRSELKKITGKWPSKPKIDSAVIHKFKAPDNMFFQTEYMQKVLNTIQNIDLSIDDSGRLNRPKEISDLKIKIGHSIYRMGIGGLHSSEEECSIKENDEYEIFDRDVASYYPRIVINCELYPKHLGKPFLLVYNGLVVRRLTAKQAKRIAESENLKVVVNGTFGKTGSPYSILYAPEMNIQITVGGQLYLLMLIEALELRGIPVYSANTDGIVIYCPKDKRQVMLDVVKQWEQITKFETEETKYSAVYSRDVNAYMAIKPDGEIKGKNVYYDPWRGKSAKDKYWRFQKNPTTQICVEAIENYIVKNIPLEKTINECRDLTKFISVKNVTGGAHKDREYLGKTIRWYYAKGINGTIDCILSGNKVPDTDGALPCMDLPDCFPEDINYAWYLAKANSMLYDLNFLKRPKQIQFF